MRHQCVLLLVALLLCSAFAAPACGQNRRKMSSFVRFVAEGQKDVQSAAKNTKSTARGNTSEPEICTFIRIINNGERILRAHYAKVLAQFGNIYIASIPVNELDKISAEKAVTRIEASAATELQMDSVIVGIGADKVYAGTNLPEAYSGKGVVVGVVDVGFDLTHPNFYDKSLSEYRISRLWDQLAASDGSMYVGAEYVGQDALLGKGCSTDGEGQTHGTETTGIAAGSGYDSPYQGVAYESELCLVSNFISNDGKFISSSDYYKYTDATNALAFKYIFDYATSVGKPCVISFSEGSYAGFLDDEQLYYEVLDSLTGPGRIFVCSAGNLAGYTNYIHKDQGVDSTGLYLYQPDSVCWLTMKSREPFDIVMKAGEAESTAFTLSSNTADILATKDSLITVTDSIDGKKFVITINAYTSVYDASSVIYDVYVSSGSGTGTAFPVSLGVKGKDATVEIFRRMGYFRRTATGGIPDNGDCTHCVMSPAVAPAAVSVGATARRGKFTNYKGEEHVTSDYQYGMRSSYSSVGPAFDGRIKPDVMAPGTNVISSESSYYEAGSPNARALNSDVARFTYNGRLYGWNCDTGTSMSAPVCAGTIALWLQANPRLTREEIIQILEKTCTHPDASLSYPNIYYGYGEVDAYKGILEVLRMVGVKDIHSSVSRVKLVYRGGVVKLILPPKAGAFSLSLYNTDGTRLLSNRYSGETDEVRLDVSALSNGIYIINVDGSQAVRGSLVFRKE